MVTISARLASLATAQASSEDLPPPESHGKRLVTTAPKPQAARPVDRPESTKSTGRYRLSHRGTYQRSPGTVQVAERRNPVYSDMRTPSGIPTAASRSRTRRPRRKYHAAAEARATGGG